MATDLTIRRMTNQSRGFYALLGPYLSRRAIVAEMGGPIWDDDAKTWYVGLAHGEPVGFGAVIEDGRRVTLQSDYTLPVWRRHGIHGRLLAARLEDLDGRPMRAMCTPAGLPRYLAQGFAVVRSRGSYTEVHHG